MIKIVPLDVQALNEPTVITQAQDFQEALANVAKLTKAWRQGAAMEIHQKLAESWALNVIHNAAKRLQER